MKNFVKKNWSKILIFVGIVCIIFIVFSVIVTIVVGNRDSKEVVAPGLIWSGNQGVMNWDKAVATCNSLGDRLPNHKELSIALRDQFEGANFSTGGFQAGELYWSSTKDFIGLIYLACSYANEVFCNGGKTKFERAVRCVH